MSLFEEPHCK